MCKRGQTYKTRINQADAEVAEYQDIDLCISPLVAGLNAYGVRTVSSCCGHGEEPGYVCFTDGCRLSIEEARKALHELNIVFSE